MSARTNKKMFRLIDIEAESDFLINHEHGILIETSDKEEFLEELAKAIDYSYFQTETPKKYTKLPFARTFLDFIDEEDLKDLASLFYLRVEIDNFQFLDEDGDLIVLGGEK